MRRWSLRQKILGLGFLHLVLAGLVVLSYARLQYGLEADSLLIGPARQRIMGIVNEFQAEYEFAEDRVGVFATYHARYNADFFVVLADEGAVTGVASELPPEVMERIREAGPSRDGKGKRGKDQPDRNKDRGKGRRDKRLKGPRDGPRDRFLFVTSHDPTWYWAGVRTPISDGQGGPSAPAVILVRSRSLLNGIFFEWRQWVWFTLAMLAVWAICWLPFLRGLTGAIAQVDQATQQIALGKFDTRAPEQRTDEVGHLGAQINLMAAKLDGFVKSQKRFLGDIAHELSAPIARVQFALGILERRVESAHQPEFESLRDEIQEMSALVNELLSFSKASLDGGTVRLEPLRVDELVRQVMARESIAVLSSIDPALSVQGHAVYLRRAIGNLLRNASRYAGEFGPIEIAATRQGDAVRISVMDQGPGLPPESLANIFEPFYRPSSSRTRDTGGVGLGLAIVKSCVEACGGSISCRNRDPKGFEVTMTLSAAD